MRDLKVLLIEPHLPTRIALAALLRGQDHHVTAMSDFTIFCKLAMERSFDLLISEVSPPHRPEFWLMRELARRDGTCGILYTAHDPWKAKGWVQAGFGAIVHKPASFDTVLQAIRRCMAPNLAGPQGCKGARRDCQSRLIMRT